MNNYKKQRNIWLYGKHAVESIIVNKGRQIYEILCVSQNYNEIVGLIAKSQRKELLSLVKTVDRAEISRHFDSDNHQSTAIHCSKKEISSIENLLQNIKSKSVFGNILVFDQLTDPQNIGAIIRSAIAFGVTDIVVPVNSFPGETASMVKASSGNFEKINIHSTNNISNFLIKIKKLDYWCVGLAGEGTDSINKVGDFEKIVVVIGSEGSGIRPLVKKSCDLLLKIPMEKGVESLNASNAASIALYELYKNKSQ